MHRKLKLLFLLILSSSVYFIFQNNNREVTNIVNIGDGLSQGINSYGFKEYSYIDYYKDSQNNNSININNDYSNKKLSFHEFNILLKTSPSLKRTLREADQVFITLGYNDLIYNLALEENNNEIIVGIQREYTKCLQEIKKYYKKKPIVIGYYNSYNNEELNIYINKLNKVLQTEDIIYINTSKIIDSPKYFSNPHSYYLNREGYQAISKEIMKKT